MTLVDLPGCPATNGGESEEGIRGLVRSIILSYIRKGDCIILVVIEPNEMENTEAIIPVLPTLTFSGAAIPGPAIPNAVALARSVDPEGSRTLGVLAMDLMKGNDVENINKLKDLFAKLPLGYVCIEDKLQLTRKLNRIIVDHVSRISSEAAAWPLLDFCWGDGHIEPGNWSSYVERPEHLKTFEDDLGLFGRRLGLDIFEPGLEYCRDVHSYVNLVGMGYCTPHIVVVPGASLSALLEMHRVINKKNYWVYNWRNFLQWIQISLLAKVQKLIRKLHNLKRASFSPFISHGMTLLLRHSTLLKHKRLKQKLEKTKDRLEYFAGVYGDVVVGVFRLCRKIDDTWIAKPKASVELNEVEDLKELSRGTFGTVYKGKWKGLIVAVRKIERKAFGYDTKVKENFRYECCRLVDIHHPNLLSFYGSVFDDSAGWYATVCEFMTCSSVRSALQKNKSLDKRNRLLIAMDVASAMEYLHSMNLVHVNLRTETLFVDMMNPQRPVCKVAGLGLLILRQHAINSGDYSSMLPWMAPEVLERKWSSVRSKKVDVYSFGIVMWELLTGDKPYAGLDSKTIKCGVRSNTLRPPIPDTCEPEWQLLMEKCWSDEPQERLTFTEIASRLRSMV